MATPAPAYSPDSYAYQQHQQYPMQAQQPQAQYAQPQYSQPQPQAHPMSSPIQHPQHMASPVQHAQQPMYHPAGSPPPLEEKNSYQQHVQQFPQMNQPQQYATAHPQGPVGTSAPPPLGSSQFANAVPLHGLSMTPAPVDCPSCRHRALTRTEKHSGNTTHVWALITWLFTLCLCFIPYLIDSLKDVEHFCGSCGTRLAKWHKSGHVEVFLHA